MQVLMVTAASGFEAEMLDPTRLDAFYSADAIASWRAVLGEKMHYHHGMWLDGDAALE